MEPYGGTMPTVEETIIFIQQAHAGQVDAAGEEY